MVGLRESYVDIFLDQKIRQIYSLLVPCWPGRSGKVIPEWWYFSHESIDISPVTIHPLATVGAV